MNEIEKKVINSIDRDFTIRTTQEIVRRPAWQDYTKPSSEWEWERAEYLQDKMIELEFDVVPIIRVGEVSYRRPNLIGFFRGVERGQPKLFWTAHIDTTCPLDRQLMPRPFDGQIEDGEVKGVGMADQLGAIGAVLGALDAIRRCKIQLRHDFMLIFPSDEMMAARGSELVTRWMKAKNIKPEFGISAECTDNQIGIAHTGINEFEIEVTGTTGHPSFKVKDIKLPMHNPVVRMFEVGLALQEIEQKEGRFKIKHPLVGSSYTWFGPIEGGTRARSICWSGAPSDPLHDGMTSYEAFGHNIKCSHMQPEYCKLLFGARTIPRRLKPGETFHIEAEKGTTNKELMEMVDKHLKELWKKSPSATKYTLRRTSDRSIPYEISPEEPHVKLLAKVMEEITGKKPRCLGTKHWTEVSRLTEQLGIPFVQVAPTWVRYHRADEGVSIVDLMESARIYAGAILRFCEVA